jgi:hypothetical protein
MKTIARVGACLSFAFCLFGGVWIVVKTGFSMKDDVVSTGIGLYFIGKAFFVGPMLWMAADRWGAKQESR